MALVMASITPCIEQQGRFKLKTLSMSVEKSNRVDQIDTFLAFLHPLRTTSDLSATPEPSNKLACTVTWLLDEDVSVARRVSSQPIPSSFGVGQPLLHQAVVGSGVAGLSPVQCQCVQVWRQALGLHTPAEPLFVGVGPVLEGPRALDPQEQLVLLRPRRAPHIPQHGVLGVGAGLGADGAVDADSAVLKVDQRLVGLLDAQLVHWMDRKTEGGRIERGGVKEKEKTNVNFNRTVLLFARSGDWYSYT